MASLLQGFLGEPVGQGFQSSFDDVVHVNLFRLDLAATQDSILPRYPELDVTVRPFEADALLRFGPTLRGIGLKLL